MIEHQQIIDDIKNALERLSTAKAGALIPEVRSNLGYALKNTKKIDDIAAVPGRITAFGHEVFTCREPSFGASSHVARVILAAMSFDPTLRSAMNLRYTPETLQACVTAGHTLASFDRSDEPEELKHREGVTLDWGTRFALSHSATPPDVISDEGEHGKEPMLRVIGNNPKDVVGKVLKILECYGKIVNSTPPR